jgi:cytochrome c peroxidase
VRRVRRLRRWPAWLLAFPFTLLAHSPPKDLAPGYSPAEFAAPIPGSYALPALRPAPDGQVVEDTGAETSLHQLFAGHLVVLSFIYTQCADANGCPLASFVLRQMAKRATQDPALKQRLRLVSLSFDPGHDTPKVLAAYAKSFRSNIDWHFVTTRDEATLAPILASYGQAVERDSNGHTLSHQLRVFLIDERGQIRNEYSTAYLRTDTLLADLKTLTLDTSPISPPQLHTITGPGDYKGGYEQAVYQTQSRAISTRVGRSQAVTDSPPLGLPSASALNGKIPTAPEIALGRRLFFERRLSHNDTVACASCHLPDHGFTNNELQTPVGIEGRSVKRNAPSLYNIGYQRRLFVDARESRLEQQIWGPLLAANEMGNPSIGFVLEKLAALDDYAVQFQRIFPEVGITMETLGAALAAYERALSSGNSPFDRSHFGTEPAALSAAAQRGLVLFRGKAGCVTCHTIEKDFALFTDQQLHNTGLGFERAMQPLAPTMVVVGPGLSLPLKPEATAGLDVIQLNDLGRYEVTQNPADRWRYRTPSLRNVALTGPYMHDGSLATLRSVVEFYNRGGIANEGLDPLIKPLHLSNTEIDELVAFLQSLTGDNVGALTHDAFSAPIGDRH